MIPILRQLRLLPIALAAAFPAHASPAPLVVIGQQRIMGTQEAGIASFKGIGYARPPLGELRWKAPQPLPPTRGRIDASRFGPACPQSEGNIRWYRGVARAMGADSALIHGPERISEDCLYLNVWTPKPRNLPAGKRLPVIVWIHGGSNENGYSHETNYLGANLARQGVVVVSINYRLGLLGYFAHPALGPDASGRQGLLDQVAALRWIRANIARFGGDPRVITVMGESAGGTNAAVLAAMPEARGMIARVIVQSGYLTSPEISPRGAVIGPAQSARLASGLFAPNATAASLRAMRWEDIVALQSHKLSGHFYAPVAEWPSALSSPLLIGSNADEYLMYLPSDQAGQAAELAAELADYPPERAARIRAIFAKLPGSHAGRVDTVSSGKAFHCPSAKLADAVAAKGQKAFVYRFERVRPGGHGLGAYHGAEIPYVFDTHDSWLAGDDRDRALSRTMQAYWVNFARSGNPNGPGLPAWPRWQAKDPRVIALDTKITVKPSPLAELCALL